MMNIYISGSISVVSLILLILTFNFLENKSLSTIPLISLFVLTIALMVFLINILKLRIANNIIDLNLIVDKQFIKKFIMMLDYKVNEHNISNADILSKNSKLSYLYWMYWINLYLSIYFVIYKIYNYYKVLNIIS